MKKLLIIPLLLISLLLGATDYYVKTGGNDASAGTSDGAAWAHHPWMSTYTGAVTLVAGDNVYMNRGDTWTIANPVVAYMTIGQSGTVGNFITTGVYGVGVKPKINISTDSSYPVITGTDKAFIKFDNLEISHHSSVQNRVKNQFGIYLISGAATVHDIVLTNCDIYHCPFIGFYIAKNNYNITIGDTTQTTTATSVSHSNEFHGIGYAAIMLHGTDPVSLHNHNKIYYNYIYDVYTEGGAAEINSYGITMGGGATSAGFPKYVYVRYNLVDNIPYWTGIDIHNGSYIYFTDNYVKNCHLGIGTQCVTVAPLTPILDSLIIDRNILENPTDDITNNFYFIQVNANGTYPTVRPINGSVSHNTIFYTARPTGEESGYGINLVACENFVSESNYFYNGSPAGSTGAFNIQRAKNVVIRKNYSKDWNKGLYITTNGDGLLSVYNNIFVNDNGLGNPMYFNTGTLTGSIEIYNNVAMSGSPTTSNIVADFYRLTLATGSSFKVKNNIFGYAQPKSTGIYIQHPVTNNGTIEIDNNIYFNSTYANSFYYSGSQRNWAYWKGLGYDVNSPNVTNNLNPMFQGGNVLTIDTAFDITAISPAINKGVDVGLTRDYADSLITGLPDIGAFEYYLDNPPAPPSAMIESVSLWVRWGTIVSNITGDGDGTISDRGLCYGTSADPDLTGSHVHAAGTTGQFTTNITGLSPNTTYHFRSFATNELYTSYSSDYEVTTPEYTPLKKIKNGKILIIR